MKKIITSVLLSSLMMMFSGAYAADSMSKGDSMSHDSMSKGDSMSHDSMSKGDSMSHDSMGKGDSMSHDKMKKKKHSEMSGEMSKDNMSKN